MWPPPEYVYRRFCFLDGIPDEYAWTCGMTPERRQTGGIGIQRMTVDDWIEMMEAEKVSKSPHLGPAPHGNLPRPRENGECECLTCTTAYAILDKAAQEEEAEDAEN
jgi:hypothetical protein